MAELITSVAPNLRLLYSSFTPHNKSHVLRRPGPRRPLVEKAYKGMPTITDLRGLTRLFVVTEKKNQRVKQEEVRRKSRKHSFNVNVNESHW